jgi:hypothetical protein
MSGTASFGKAHLAVHSEIQVVGSSLGLPQADPQLAELKKERTNMKNNKQGNKGMNNRSSTSTPRKLPTRRLRGWLMAMLMVPLV